MGDWAERSWRVIDKVHAALPIDATFEQRRQAIREAYPFGERRRFPYKAWLAAQKKYLSRYAPNKPRPLHPPGPLFGKDTQ